MLSDWRSQVPLPRAWELTDRGSHVCAGHPDTWRSCGPQVLDPLHPPALRESGQRAVHTGEGSALLGLGGSERCWDGHAWKSLSPTSEDRKLLLTGLHPPLVCGHLWPVASLSVRTGKERQVPSEGEVDTVCPGRATRAWSGRSRVARSC